MLRNVKIAFHNMEHSEPMESHTRQKLEKISEFLKNEENSTPLFAEFWLKSNKQHPHHEAEFHLRTSRFDLNAHDVGADMYVVIDNTIDKMVALIKKENEMRRDRSRRADTEKKKFNS
jgi:ribosomal subunit interface protein